VHFVPTAVPCGTTMSDEDDRPGGPASYMSMPPSVRSDSVTAWSVETFTAASLTSLGAGGPPQAPGPALAGTMIAPRQILAHDMELPLSVPATVHSAQQPSRVDRVPLQTRLAHAVCGTLTSVAASEHGETPPADHEAETFGVQARPELEAEHDGFVHSRDSLGAICGHSNSLSYVGPLGEMLDSYETVFRHVPGSSLFWTKQAVSAALTRRASILLLYVIAVMFLYDTGHDVSSMIDGSRQAGCQKEIAISSACSHADRCKKDEKIDSDEKTDRFRMQACALT